MTANRLRILSTICVSILVANAIFAQTGRKISGIETEGLQTLTTETVIATSGLKIGETFSVEATDAAAERLLSSGLFKRVAYRTRTAGTNVTITFQLEEVKGQSSPVVFDNFIWFSDEELAAAIIREVPSFNGSAPDIGNTNEAIRKALQNLLTERKLPGQVEYNLTEHEHLFRVAGVPMKICTLHFPGAQSVSEQKLIQATRSSMDLEYSRQSAKTFPKYGLYPIYRELGHLRASFGPKALVLTLLVACFIVICFASKVMRCTWIGSVPQRGSGGSVWRIRYFLGYFHQRVPPDATALRY